MAEWRWPLEQNCMERELLSAKLFPKTVEISSFFFLRVTFALFLLLTTLLFVYLLSFMDSVQGFNPKGLSRFLTSETSSQVLGWSSAP